MSKPSKPIEHGIEVGKLKEIGVLILEGVGVLVLKVLDGVILKVLGDVILVEDVPLVTSEVFLDRVIDEDIVEVVLGAQG